MLTEIMQRVNQKGFATSQILTSLKSMKLETPKERFDLLLEVIKYAKSLNIRLVESYELLNINDIPNFLANASTYKNNNKIVSHSLSEVLRILSYEFIKVTGNNMDYDKLDKYITGEIEFFELMEEPKLTNHNNSMWFFTGKDGVEYKGEGVAGMMKLKGPDIQNILEGYQSDDEQVMRTIQEIYNPKNEALLKKEFKNVRQAGVSLIKYLMGNIKGESKIMKLFN